MDCSALSTRSQHNDIQCWHCGAFSRHWRLNIVSPLLCQNAQQTAHGHWIQKSQTCVKCGLVCKQVGSGCLWSKPLMHSRNSVHTATTSLTTPCLHWNSLFAQGAESRSRQYLNTVLLKYFASIYYLYLNNFQIPVFVKYLNTLWAALSAVKD